MGKLKLNCEIKDDLYGKPSLYKVYVDTDHGYNAGMSWFYYDMWIKRGDEWIYRFFECPNKVINEVKLVSSLSMTLIILCLIRVITSIISSSPMLHI